MNLEAASGMTVPPNAASLMDDPIANPPKRTPLTYLAPNRNPWIGRGVFVAFAIALFVLPSIVTDPTRIQQWSQYLCYAAIAVGIDIAWGYGGMLTLGQGLFFGLGAYAMGMHLKLENTLEGQIPDFMSLYSKYKTLPAVWKPFQSFTMTIVLGVLVPVAVASLLGLLVFKRRIRGPFFAVLTQATAIVFWLILVGQLPLTAGTNGLTDFTQVFGKNTYAPETQPYLYRLSAIMLLGVLLLAVQIVRSRFGRLLVATRDAEDRVRFLGYDPAIIKTIAFALSALFAAIAGMMIAPVIALVAPNQFTALPSILMVCWVAVGGRGTLWGAVLGAIAVKFGETRLSEAAPEAWEYGRGLLFIGIVAFVPGGIAGLLKLLRSCGSRFVPSKGEAAVDLTAGGVTS